MMDNSKEELEHTLSLLQIEQEEDRMQYKELVLNKPLSERKNLGISWYPVVIRESFYGMGERLILEIERPTNTDVPHLFQSGRVAALFSNLYDEGRDNPVIAGVVTSVRANNLRLTLFVDELPDWAEKGKLGLDLMFDETSYKEMESAMQRVIKAKNNRLAQLREVLLGFQQPSFKPVKYPISIPGLNSSQNEAINKVISAEDVAIIHGPPGTGKTTTLVQAIVQTLKQEKQVLVCAASNTAVDLLTEKLFAEGINVVRFGNPSRINDAQLSHTLDYKIAAHKEYKQIKELKKRAVEFRNMALKYKRNFGKEEREQRKVILSEARKIQEEAEKLEKYITEDLVANAQVCTTTLVGASVYLIRDREFPVVFIDEAAQALEPACWIPITKARKVVFAGDHCQLPPTVKSIKAAKEGLDVTLFEKSINRIKADVMLEVQYRMNDQIMQFSNKEFYQGRLKAHESVKDISLPASLPVEFIDTAGCGFTELYDANQSVYNPEEMNILFIHFQQLLQEIDQESRYTYGVISPYKAQVNLMKEKLEEIVALEGKSAFISVNTVDGFQGQERDVIYISLVRSNDKGEIGFLNDIRRMNVAITRAKR
ncbi:MAG TPA: AAA domain-containing protein, partial [Cytophagaceae bacterium]